MQSITYNERAARGGAANGLMAHHPVMRKEATDFAVDTQATACPGCGVQLIFGRSATPLIDACGLESYRLKCNACGALLAGIVDPADDTLLLSELPR